MAVHNLVGSLGGVGLSALFVCALSDHLHGSYGQAAIRYALVPPFLCLLPASGLYLLAARYIGADVMRIS